MCEINEPLISIIIPLYNVENYIDKCMESICSQSYKALEIILVDDGSTDKSPEKCDAWANKDFRIHVIHKKNGGVSSARNRGLDIATGDYITFVDPDDYVAPGLYEDVSRYFFDYEMIEIGHYEVEESGKVYIDTFSDSLRDAFTHEEILEKIYPKTLGFSVKDIEKWDEGENIYANRATCMVWQFFFKADLIRKNDLRFKEDLNMQEDDIFLNECLAFCGNLKVISTPYYYYVQRGSSISHLLSVRKELDKKYKLLKFKNLIRKAVLKNDNVDILDCMQDRM